MNKKETKIEFNKRFANGEQYLYINGEGKIQTEQKEYYWQDRCVYNRIAPVVARVKAINKDITDETIYGESGIVARLIPIQRAYNAIKNRRHEYLNRIAMGILIVEDGSIDLDNIEEEGIAPGKVIVYRQGSMPPKMLEMPVLFNEFAKIEDSLLNDFYAIVEANKEVNI